MKMLELIDLWTHLLFCGHKRLAFSYVFLHLFTDTETHCFGWELLYLDYDKSFLFGRHTQFKNKIVSHKI